MISILLFLIAVGVLVFGSAAVCYLIQIASDVRQIRSKMSDEALEQYDSVKETRKVFLTGALGVVVFFVVVMMCGGFQA